MAIIEERLRLFPKKPFIITKSEIHAERLQLLQFDLFYAIHRLKFFEQASAYDIT